MEQDYKVDTTIIYQDNISSILLEKNGRVSAGGRTKHLDVKYFYITDLVEKEEVKIEYCPTNKMTADYMTKPLHGSKFKIFRSEIMGNDNK